jgi:hypothetical protein
MAYRTVLQALQACLRADASVAAVVGTKVFGTIAFNVAPPFVVVELVKTDFDFRVPTDTQKSRLETTSFLVKCAALTSDAADVLAGMAANVLDDLLGNATFAVTNAFLTDSLLGDYTLTVDPERAPDASPVFVGILTHAIKLTVTRSLPA